MGAPIPSNKPSTPPTPPTPTLTPEKVEAVTPQPVAKPEAAGARQGVQKPEDGTVVPPATPAAAGTNPVAGVATPTVRGDEGFRVGEARRPTIRWDDDFQRDPNARESWGDWATRKKYDVQLAGAEALGVLTDGTRGYRHWREGNGEDLIVNYEKAIREDPAVAAGVDAEIGRAQREAERLHARLNPPGPLPEGQEPTNEFNFTGSAVGNSSGTENWQKAIGEHKIWSSGTVSYDPATDTFTMRQRIEMEDRYNFNAGQADITSGQPDDENGRLEELGYGTDFTSRGVVYREVTWKRGDAPAPGQAPAGEVTNETGRRDEPELETAEGGRRDRNRNGRDRDAAWAAEQKGRLVN